MTETAPAPSAAARRFAQPFASRTELIDAGMIAALGLIAMYGFHDTYAGVTYLVAGAAGLLLGIALAMVANWLRQPVIVLAVFTIAAFFLLGGAVALHGDGAAAFLPLPDTLVQLADQSVHGWKELLTTLPPVDGGPLLTLPYLLGLVAGTGGVTLATRFRSAALPALVPLALLAAVILLGVYRPTRVAVLGAVFGVVLIAWIIARARRLRRTAVVGNRQVRQRATAVLLCAGAVAVAAFGGVHLPGTGGDRVVLRTDIKPPENVGQYPSPLAGFRKYTTGVKPALSLNQRSLMTVTGLPADTLLRFATLDAYNSTVWGASNNAYGDPGATDTFQKVASRIDTSAKGRTVRAIVKIEDGYSGVWMPTYGALTRISFDSTQLLDEADDFRYNIGSSTGLVPEGLRTDDTYSFEAVIADPEPLTAETEVWPQGLPEADGGDGFPRIADDLAGGAQTKMGQVLAVASHLKTQGRFSHGASSGPFAFPAAKAGHSVQRLKKFLTDPQIVGDEEQYTAAMAIIANQLGVPARVVMGAKLPANGPVKGADVTAWVELRVADGSWQVLPTEQYLGTEKPEQPKPPEQPDQKAALAVPPPVPVRPPSTVGDSISDTLNRQAKADNGFHLHIPGFVIAILKYVVLPLAVLALLVGLIVFLKGRRRTRRRTRGPATRRLAMGYRDALDQARDLGRTAYAGQTRREQAHAVGIQSVLVLAHGADARTFGAGDLSDAEVEAFWTEVDEVRTGMVAPLTRWQRLKAAVNLTSFRPLPRSEDV